MDLRSVEWSVRSGHGKSVFGSVVSLIFITSKISSNNCCWLVWLKVFLKKGKK